MSSSMLEHGLAQDPLATKPGPPLWLLAELTYRCPLHCAFCFNPVDFATQKEELDTEGWIRTLQQARALGSVQCGFSGGEPMLRDDLETLVGEAHRLGFYTNLLTTGVGLTDTRARALKDNGLDHIQLSFQDSTRETNDFLSNTRTFDLKHKVAAMIKEYDWPMVLNCVIHRMNIEHVDKIIEMALELGAETLELANTQYYSWAVVNRDHLLPSREQLVKAEKITNEYRERYGDRITIVFVVPDYYENRPKKCMNGWGNVFLSIAPDGTALPCHTARMLPGAAFPNVADHSIEEIWYGSEGFNRYRGKGWMKEPCRSCSESDDDLGGCRCQAFLLAGDPAAADPVCDKSPDRHVVDSAIELAQSASTFPQGEQPLIFRDPKESIRLTEEQS
ncbi:MAG: pyrroloquinoline quinone biosynthesis protein E [Granulosicoccus sp.]|jgi:pyrroloquinoline quinone biosynthesis protein E